MRAFPKAVVLSATHTAAWLLAFFLMRNVVAADSPAAAAYGFLSGWWAALYVGYVCKVQLRSFPIVFVGYLLAAGLFSLLHLRWLLYHDADGWSLWGFISYVVGAFVFTSPILVNSWVQFLVSKKDHAVSHLR